MIVWGNRCAMCGYGTEVEWHDHGICDDCRRHLDRVEREDGYRPNPPARAKHRRVEHE